jgi:transposase-like protein
MGGASGQDPASDHLKLSPFDVWLKLMAIRRIWAELLRNGGNKERAAAALGMSRHTIYRYLRWYDERVSRSIPRAGMQDTRGPGTARVGNRDDFNAHEVEQLVDVNHDGMLHRAELLPRQ